MSNIKKQTSIMIIGDSWGVPNYPPTNYINNRIDKIKKMSSNVEIKFQHLGDPPETHIEYLLKDAGNNVINLSKNGGSNLEAIQFAKDYLENNNIKIDWLIWFHTESLRDRDEILISKKIKFSIPKLSKDLAVLAYKEFSKLLNLTKSRAIVIGGQAPIFIKEFRDHVGGVDLLIEDWHSDIHGIKLPFTHAVCNLDLFEFPNCTDSIEDKNRMLNDIDQILRLDYESEDFPDNAHPGKRAHALLFEQYNKLLDTMLESKIRSRAYIDVYQMFSTPVARIPATPENYDSIQAEIQSAIQIIEETNDSTSVSYLYKGTKETEISKKTYDFIEKYNCKNLKTKIIKAVEEYLNKIGWQGSRAIILKNSWINIADKDDHHGHHCHPGYSISGVYYYRVNEKQGTISFNNPNPLMFACNFPQGVACPQTVDIIPDDGDILLFPSWLVHSTRKNATDEQRISIAFNIDIVETDNIAVGLTKHSHRPYNKIEQSLKNILRR